MAVTWHCKHERLVAAYFSGSAMPRLAQGNVVPQEHAYIQNEDSEMRENSRGEVSESLADLSRMISSARSCAGLGNLSPQSTFGRGSRVGPGAKRQKNYHFELDNIF